MNRQDFSFGWYPSSDAMHAPPSALLRADNLIWEDRGIVSLRPGSALLFTLADLDVHSLHTAFLAGVRYRMQGAGNNVYANGVKVATDFDGTGDISIYSWLGHAFMGRGKVRKKYNGTLLSNWGMQGPTVPVAAYSIGNFTTVVASFHLDESPAFVVEEGTSLLDIANVSASGTVISAGTAYPGWEVARAFDGILTTGMSIQKSAGVNYVGLDYGTATHQILAIRIGMVGGSYGFNAKFQYSDDGTAWFDAGLTINRACSVQGYLTYTVPANGAHRYWRFLDQGGFDWFQVFEIQMFTSASAGYVTGADGVTNGAIEVKPDSGSGRGTLVKTWTADQDFLSIAGYIGDDRDILDLLTWIQDPREVETISVLFGLSLGPDPFADDYLYFDFRLGGAHQGTVSLPAKVVTDNTLQNVVVNSTSVTNSNNSPGTTTGGGGGGGSSEVGSNPVGSPRELTGTDPDPEDEIQFSSVLGRSVDPEDQRRRERKERSFNPGWTHLSAMRGQFNRVGTTPGRTWATVRAIKIVYKAITGSVGVARFDTMQFLGGAGTRALVGQYQFKIRFAHPTGNFMERSAASPPSKFIDLIGNAASIVVPKAAMQAKDPQADFIWVYMYGGTLGDYYLVHQAGVLAYPANFGYRITEFPKKPSVIWTSQKRIRLVTEDFAFPNGNNLALTADGGYREHEWGSAPDGQVTSQDRRRLTTGDFAASVESPAGDDSLTIEVRADEANALATNEVLERDTRLPPQYIVGVAGPYEDRLLVLAQEPGKRGLLHASERRQPSQFRFSRAFAIGDDTETCYWVVVTYGGAYVGTSRDIYALTGNGNENDDDTIDLELKGMHIASPPVGPEVASEGNGFAYRAKDGWRTFDGAASIMIPRDAVDLLYKGKTRHGVAGVEVASRFRAALFNNQLTAITPEIGGLGVSSTVLHRYDSALQKWMRHTYPYNMRVIHREPDGTLLIGDAAGHVYQLDTGTSDNGTKISLVLWTPVDDFGSPLYRKDGFDYQILADTGGDTATINLHLDNSGVSGDNASLVAATPLLFKKNISSLGPWRRVQYRMGGNFNTFKLFEVATNHRLRPMHRFAVDTGYIQTGKQDLNWVREVRVMACSPTDLELVMDFDGVQSGGTVGVIPNQTSIYTVPMPKGTKGNQLRIQINAVAAPGTGEVGFELYWIEIRYEGSGNVTDKQILRVTPEGVAQ